MCRVNSVSYVSVSIFYSHKNKHDTRKIKRKIKISLFDILSKFGKIKFSRLQVLRYENIIISLPNKETSTYVGFNQHF